MKNDVQKTNLTRERILWVGAIILTAVVFLVIGLSSPFSFSNMRVDDAGTVTVEKSDVTSTSEGSASSTMDGTTVTTTSSALSAPQTTSYTQTTTATTTAPTAAVQPSGKININTATAEQLMTVPGIGEVFAQRIIEYRDAHNGFRTLSELKEVKGVGDGRYNSWEPYLTVG